MSLSDLPEVYPGVTGLDDLELLHHGFISLDLLSSTHRPAKYLDAEGVPVASLTRTGQLLWIAPRSSRPFEHWYLSSSTLTPPLAVVDQPRSLRDLPKEVGTVVVLASTEASRSDLHLVRMAKQKAEEDCTRLVILPLGSTAAHRPEKLTQVLDSLRQIGPVTDYTSLDPPPLSPDHPGLVVFFTGLSGSGKSTLARSLAHHLIEKRGFEVSLLDGDLVRRHLSQGLTFSIADRNTNVRRIGWVAAEIARHGGVVIACPIAPFDATRHAVRQMVAESGSHFLLVHVATPLEECERRDRKGLYAKARAGEIPDFTGISSPYETPEDADLRLDTTITDVTTLTGTILSELETRDWVTAPTCGSPSSATC